MVFLIFITLSMHCGMNGYIVDSTLLSEYFTVRLFALVNICLQLYTG